LKINVIDYDDKKGVGKGKVKTEYQST